MFGVLFTGAAISIDTAFYKPEINTLRGVFRDPVITPLNNFIYNYAPENLAKHGVHPFYHHFVANLPLLLGPAYPLVLLSYRRSVRLYSAICGLVVLSLFPHQEARFLIPAVPLILSSIRLPAKIAKQWIATWAIFNVFFGILMGTYHQGGVVPTQIHLASNSSDINHVLWWKTYSPPIWLLNGRDEDVRTTDLMGMDPEEVRTRLLETVVCSWKRPTPGIALVAPASAIYLDRFSKGNHSESLILQERWRTTHHLNLDDLDFGDDGVWNTLSRVVGRRGLVVWDVTRKC